MELKDKIKKEVVRYFKKGPYKRSDNGYSAQDPELFMRQNWGKKNLDGSWTMERDLILRNNSPIVKNGKFILHIKSVARNFNCSGQDLITLEGGPEEVGGNFWCEANKLTSLEYGPKKVGGDYSCSDNKISDLKYLPKVINGDLDVSSNLLKEFSSFPKLIKGDLDVSANLLKDFLSFPKLIKGNLDISLNKFKNFIGVPKIKGEFTYDDNPLKTYYGLTGKEKLNSDYIIGITNGEYSFISKCLAKGKVPEDYYEQLFNHIIYEHFEDVKLVKWPKGFLNVERKRLISSKTSINKFKL